MKQKSKTEIEQTNTLIQRRAVGLWVLGAGGAWVLAACGGGAGGVLGIDDDRSDDYTFRAAFDALRAGMDRRRVVDLVGRQPQSEALSQMRWHIPTGEGLRVSFRAGRESPPAYNFISYAMWTGPVPVSQELRREFPE
jgi:hypothetical protein